MTRPVLLATADWHIARGAWTSRSIHGDSYHSLKQIVDFAIRHHAPVIAAGDLYDTDTPDPVSVGFVQSQMARLHAAQVPLSYVIGQHERHVAGAWLGVGAWPVHLASVPSEMSTLAGTVGWDWMPAAVLAQKIEELNACAGFIEDRQTVLVCHQAWAEFMGDSRSEGRLADIDGSCTIITGDYHGPDDSLRSLKVGNHLVLSPGPICMQSIDECPVKTFWVLWQEDDGTQEWRLEPLETRAVLQYRVEPGWDSSEVFDWIAVWLESYARSEACARLPGELQKPLVGAWFPADRSDVMTGLGQFKDRAHVFAKPVTRKAERNPVQSGLRPNRRLGLIDVLDQEVPVGDPRRGPLESLLTAPDPAGALKQIKETWFP